MLGTAQLNTSANTKHGTVTPMVVTPMVVTPMVNRTITITTW